MITKLANDIKETLSPKINSNYIFLDLPYYTNIGDTLIWKGTEDFLSTLPYKCLYRASIETYFKPEVKTDTVILLQGGGNFGDLWRRHTNFCLQIIKDFPENKIIILSQTVYYKSQDTLKSDALEMGKHSDLTICARDKVTHKLLLENFTNNIELLPDMAFCINSTYLSKYAKQETDKSLFFLRKDQELQNFDFNEYIPKDESIDQMEWPSMDRVLFPSRVLNLLFRIYGRINKKVFGRRLLAKIIDYYCVYVYMPYLLRVGIRFISKYKYMYTTRLHGAILSILLGKPITFFDNSYGKNSTFYNAWLTDFKNVKMIEQD